MSQNGTTSASNKQPDSKFNFITVNTNYVSTTLNTPVWFLNVPFTSLARLVDSLRVFFYIARM